MVKVVGAKFLPRENDLLESVTIDSSSEHNNDYIDLTMIDDKDIVFSQEFIKSHCEEYNIATNLCSKCDDASKFFADDRTLTDTIVNEKIQWVQDKKANMDTDPYPELEYPIYDPQNLGCEFLDSRPKGQIKIVRRTQ